MRHLHFVLLCSILGACGPVEDFDDSSCVDTWWYLEVEDEIVLSGNHAVIQQFGGGIQGFNGDFHDGKDTVVESCGLVSQQDLAVGLHNSLTCIVSTEQGPNPSWTAAQDSEMDFRPNLVELQKNGDMISGLISGQIYYQKILNYSTLQTEANFVSYNFGFDALKDYDNICTLDKESPCLEACWKKYVGCRAKCKRKPLPERPNCFSECSEVHSKCRRSCND